MDRLPHVVRRALSRWRPRRIAWALGGVLALDPTIAAATEPVPFRIASGGPSGTYFPVADVIADAVNRTPDFAMRFFAVAQSSNGSVSNLEDLSIRDVEAALAQADIVALAARGAGSFTTPLSGLRHVASLFPESLHVVVQASLSDRPVRDLAGLRLSVDERKSGTLATLERNLGRIGLGWDRFTAVYYNSSTASERLLQGRIDGFFLIAGPPTAIVTELLRKGGVALLSIGPADYGTVGITEPEVSFGVIPRDAYGLDRDVPTIQTMSQLLVREDLDPNIVYALTKTIWNETTVQKLRARHRIGAAVRLENALSDRTVPLHPGAGLYYEEVGLLR